MATSTVTHGDHKINIHDYSTPPPPNPRSQQPTKNNNLELQQPPVGRFSPYVAGIDVAAQNEALMANPIQDKVTILQPVGQSTSFCVNFGGAIISLFSAFSLIIGCAALAFSIWAMAKHHTTLTNVMVALSCVLIAISLAVAFRNMCFKFGNLSSIFIISVLLIATLVLTIAFTFWPAQVSRFVGRLDQGHVERNNPETQFELDLTRSAHSPPHTDPNDPSSIVFKLSRTNIGQMMYNNYVVLTVILWLGVVTQALAIAYLIVTFKALREKKYVTKAAVIQ